MRQNRGVVLVVGIVLVASGCASTQLIEVDKTTMTCDIPGKVVTVNYQVSLAAGAEGPTTYTFLTQEEGAAEVQRNVQTLSSPDEWTQEAARIEQPTTVIFRDAAGKQVTFQVNPAKETCPTPTGAA